MKFRSPNEWVRFERHRKRRLRKSTLKRRKFLELRAEGLDRHERRDERPQPDLSSGPLYLDAPKLMSLTPDAIDDTLRLFNTMREAGLRDGRSVVINLNSCDELSPEAAVLFAAEAHRLRWANGKDSVVASIATGADRHHAVIRLMGIMDLVPENERPPAIEGISPTGLLQTGVSLDGEDSKRLAKEFADGLNLDEDGHRRIHAALNDALENISEHAYSETTANKAETGRWWACAVTLADKATSYLLACDLGATIPKTLPVSVIKKGKSNLSELIKMIGKKSIGTATDQDLLRAAFEPRVTRRPGGKGGRGLPRMRQLVDEYQDGLIFVWSGRAVAWASTGEELKSMPLKESVGGTFVMWKIVNGEQT